MSCPFASSIRVPIEHSKRTPFLARAFPSLRQITVAVMLLCGTARLGHAQNEFHASIQFVNALADTGAVDVYVSEHPLADSVAYQRATAYQTIHAGDYFVALYVAGADTSSASPLVTRHINLPANQRAMLVLFGPAIGPRLLLRTGAREQSYSDMLEFFMIHAAPDTGPVDLRLRDPYDSNRVTALLFNNLGYGRYSIYTRLELRGYNYEIIQSYGNAIVGTYYLNLSGFANLSGVVIAAGRGNSSNDGFTLFGVDVNGEVYLPDVTTGLPDEVPMHPPLLDAYPNPSVGEVKIVYTVDMPSTVTLQVVDLHGRIVARLHDGWHAAGTFEKGWNGRATSGAAVPSGMYLVRQNGRSGVWTVPVVRIR